MAADTFGDLRHCIPEFVDVHVSSAFDKIENLIQRCNFIFGGSVVLIGKANLLNRCTGKVGKSFTYTEMRLFHTGMENKQLAVG